MTPIIKLPQGEDFVNALELPRQIVSALVATGRLDAIPDSNPLLSNMEKKFPQSDPHHYLVQKLSDADVALLKEIAPDSPFWSKGTMTQAEYATFKVAFENAPNKPEWELMAEFRDCRSETKAEHGKVIQAHLGLLDAAIKGGKLRALTEHHAPAEKLEPRCIIAIDEARDYLAGIGIKLAQSEAARMESEQYGYQANPDNMNVTLSSIPEQLDTWAQAADSTSTTADGWAYYLAHEFVNRNGWQGEERDAKWNWAYHDFMMLFENQAGKDLSLETGTGTPWQSNSGKSWVNSHVKKGNMRQFIRKHMPAEWMFYNVLKDVDSMQALHVQWKAQADSKAQAGRYTLEEAAKLIADNGNENTVTVTDRLMQAAKSGALTVYKPGATIPYIPATVRGFYEEAHWDDLNAWLDTNAPRLTFKFSDPSKAEATSAVNVQTAERLGKTDIDTSAKQELAEIIALPDISGMPPELWAHWLAWDFCFANGQPGHWVGLSHAEIQYMRAFEAHRGSLPLRQHPTLILWPKNLELPPQWATGLVMLKGELRTWATENCPDMIGRLLGTQADVEPASAEVGTIGVSEANKLPAPVPSPKIVTAFAGLHWNVVQWKGNLADPSKWLAENRIEKGKQGRRDTPATWNPVLIAVALSSREQIPKHQLDRAMTQFPEWRNEWEKASEYLE